MARTLILFIFLFISQSLWAQKIHFSDSSNVWKIRTVAEGGYSTSYFQCQYSSDTLINGIMYKILQDRYTQFIREDTALNIVYVLSSHPAIDSAADTTEQILYNFNWQLNDTVVNFVRGSFYKHTIIAIDSVLIQGVQHKVWFLSGGVSYTVIEGIGCLYYPIFPIDLNIFEHTNAVVCFSNNQGTPLVSPAVSYYFDNATSCTAGTA